MSKVKTVALWVLQVLLALMFVPPGFTKLASPAAWSSRFANWGLPEFLVPIVGVVELVGVIGLLIPAVAAYAAGALMGIMVGASLTHLLNDEAPRAILTVALLLLLGLVAYVRHPAFLRRA